MMFLHPSGLSAVALRIQRGLLEVEYTERRFVMYPYGIERGEVGQPGTRGPVGAPGYDY